MNIIRKPCSPKNFMPGRPGGLHPAAIVIHISEGSLASADAWFDNAAARSPPTTASAALAKCINM